MLVDLIAWRNEQKPECITYEEVAPILAQEILVSAGADQAGRPILLGRGRNLYTSLEERPARLRTLAYMFEKSTTESTKVADGYINVILDMKGKMGFLFVIPAQHACE